MSNGVVLNAAVRLKKPKYPFKIIKLINFKKNKIRSLKISMTLVPFRFNIISLISYKYSYDLKK